MAASSNQVMTIWQKICGPGLDQAGRALGQMTGLEFVIQDTAVKEVLWRDIMAKYEGSGQPEYYAISLGATGLISARILLVFTPDNARAMVSVLMGEEVTGPLDDMALSALGEVGNVVGTAFLNVFANVFGEVFEPTVPEVRRACGSHVLPPFPSAQSVLITEALFRVTGEAMTAEILIVPLKMEVW